MFLINNNCLIFLAKGLQKQKQLLSLFQTYLSIVQVTCKSKTFIFFFTRIMERKEVLRKEWFPSKWEIHQNLSPFYIWVFTGLDLPGQMRQEYLKDTQ